MADILQFKSVAISEENDHSSNLVQTDHDISKILSEYLIDNKYNNIFIKIRDVYGWDLLFDKFIHNTDIKSNDNNNILNSRFVLITIKDLCVKFDIETMSMLLIYFSKYKYKLPKFTFGGSNVTMRFGWDLVLPTIEITDKVKILLEKDDFLFVIDVKDNKEETIKELEQFIKENKEHLLIM